MEGLTINKAQELFDKVIEWKAPAAEGNCPYGGKAIITDLKASNRPIVATILEGDNLNYAICEDDMHVDFSDYGRGVMFRVIDDIYEVNDTETGNYTIYKGESLMAAIDEIISDIQGEDPSEWDLYKNRNRIWCGKINNIDELKALAIPDITANGEVPDIVIGVKDK